MQRTDRYRTSSTVAGADPPGAKAWLARTRAWEDRLGVLEAHRAGSRVGARSRLREPLRSEATQGTAVLGRAS